MARERLSMRKTREILRQKWLVRCSNRAVAQSVGVSVGAVGETLRRAREAGLTSDEGPPAARDLLHAHGAQRAHRRAAGGAQRQADAPLRRGEPPQLEGAAHQPHVALAIQGASPNMAGAVEVDFQFSGCVEGACPPFGGAQRRTAQQGVAKGDRAVSGGGTWPAVRDCGCRPPATGILARS